MVNCQIKGPSCKKLLWTQMIVLKPVGTFSMAIWVASVEPNAPVNPAIQTHSYEFGSPHLLMESEHA